MVEMCGLVVYLIIEIVGYEAEFGEEETECEYW